MSLRHEPGDTSNANAVRLEDIEARARAEQAALAAAGAASDSLPPYAIIEPAPGGLVAFPTFAALAAHVFDQLDGRPWVSVAARAAYPGIASTFPIVNLYVQRAPGTPDRAQWLLSAVLPGGDLARLDARLEALMNAIPPKVVRLDDHRSTQG